MHFLGPPANGTNLHPPPFLSPFQRSGLKSATSEPQISARCCIPYVDIKTRLSFGRKTVLLPSGPRPRGSVVSWLRLNDWNDGSDVEGFVDAMLQIAAVVRFSEVDVRGKVCQDDVAKFLEDPSVASQEVEEPAQESGHGIPTSAENM